MWRCACVHLLHVKTYERIVKGFVTLSTERGVTDEGITRLCSAAANCRVAVNISSTSRSAISLVVVATRAAVRPA